jgi:hypothetical protein
MLKETTRFRDRIQSREIEPSGSGVNSGRGMLSGRARTKRSADNRATRMLDVLVAEIMLQRPSIHTLIGQLEPS